MVPILLGRVGERPFGVVGTVDDDETPHEDDGTVGHEDAPGGDEANVEVQANIDVENAGVDGAIQSWTAVAEILKARLAPSAYAGHVWRPGQVSA